MWERGKNVFQVRDILKNNSEVYVGIHYAFPTSSPARYKQLTMQIVSFLAFFWTDDYDDGDDDDDDNNDDEEEEENRGRGYA